MDVPTEVVVAAMSTTGVLGAAAIGAFESIRRRVGKPNGHGNLVEMIERVLAGQAAQDGRLTSLEGGQHELRKDVARLEGRVDVLERRPPAA